MASRRRKGTKGANAKSELSLGDLVLAKVKGFPAWPAKISRPEDWGRVPDPKKYFVQFFGTGEIGFILPPDIQAFTIEAKNKVIARCQGKTFKQFAPAVQEICEAFEELQQKSSGPSDEAYISSFGSSVPCDNGLESKVAEDTLKGETGSDGSNGETEGSVQINHGPGLEGCSKGQGDAETQHVIPKAGDSFSQVDSSKKKNKPSKDSTESPTEVALANSPDSHYREEVSCDGHEENPLRKALANGHRSEKIVTGSKMKAEGVPKAQKSTNSSVLTSSKHETTSSEVEYPGSNDPDGEETRLNL